MAQSDQERSLLSLDDYSATSGDDDSISEADNASLNDSASEGELTDDFHWNDTPFAIAAANQNETIQNEDIFAANLSENDDSMLELLEVNFADSGNVEPHETSLNEPITVDRDANEEISEHQLTTTSEQSRSTSCADSPVAGPAASGHVMCPICQEIIHFNNLQHAPLAVSMLCGHMYHEHCLTNWVDTGKETCPTCRTTCQKRLIQRIYPEWCATSTSTVESHAEIQSTVPDDGPTRVHDREHGTETQRATELLTTRMLGALRLTLAERDQLRTLGAALVDIVANRLGSMEQSLDRLFHDTEEVGGVMRDQHERLCRLFSQMRAERNEYRSQAAQMGDAYMKSRQLCRELLNMANQLKAGQIEPTHALNQRLLALCQAQSEQLQLMQLDISRDQGFSGDTTADDHDAAVPAEPTVTHKQINTILKRYGFSADPDENDFAATRKSREASGRHMRGRNVTYIDQLLNEDVDDTHDEFQDAELEDLYKTYLKDYNSLTFHKNQSTSKVSYATGDSDKKIEQLRQYVNKAHKSTLDHTLFKHTFSISNRAPTIDTSSISSNNSTSSLISSGSEPPNCDDFDSPHIVQKQPLRTTPMPTSSHEEQRTKPAGINVTLSEEAGERIKKLQRVAEVEKWKPPVTRIFEIDEKFEHCDLIYDRIVARARRLEALESRAVVVSSTDEEDEPTFA